MQIALFLPNWLGDLAMATPALRAIRRHFGPGARLVGIVRPHLAEVLAGTRWLDEQWCFDPHAREAERRRLALVRRMRREQFDVVVLLTNSLHTAVLAWLGGARRRVGYVRDGRGLLLTDKVYPLRIGRHIAPAPMVDTYLALARAIGCPPESRRLQLATTPLDERQADAAWEALGLRGDGRVIALSSGGAYGPAKLWPAESFALLARRIAEQLDHDVLVVCGPQDEELARTIVSRAEHPRVFSLADQPLGIGLTKACLRRARLLVSTDSGPRHVAAAFDKPVITLFGPTMPVWVENPTVRAVNLQLALDCIGCYGRVCPLRHHRCMRDLSVDAVFAAVASMVQEEATVGAA